MTYYDEVPIPYEAYDWDPDGNEEREHMEDVFESITQFDHDRRHLHNRDGFYADFAFSEKCLALGHKEPEPDKDGAYDPYSDDQHYLDGDHISGWDSDVICEGTKWGVACSECEGECDYLVEAPNIWEMKGVAA